MTCRIPCKAAMSVKARPTSCDAAVKPRGILTVSWKIRSWPCSREVPCASRCVLGRSASTSRGTAGPLLSGLSAWACEGTVHDHFIQVTEGVIAREELGFPERPVDAEIAYAGEHELDVALALRGGRAGRPAGRARRRRPRRARAAGRGRAAAARARVGRRAERALRRARRAPRARASTTPGGAIQLGADRAYTGPDCPPDLLDLGGIPQGDYAPAPWLQSSARLRGLVRDVRATGRASTSTARCACRRARPPGRCASTSSPTPPPPPACAATSRLTGPARRCCPSGATGSGSRATSTPTRTTSRRTSTAAAGTGSRSTRSCSTRPWETQYNTWEFNPHQFPDFAGMMARFRASGVRTVVWVTPWVNLDSRDGQIPPDPGSQRLHRGAGAQLRRGRRRRALRPRRRRRAARRALVDGHRVAGRLHLGRRRGVVARAGQARRSRSASRGSRPTTARAGTSPTTRASPTARPAAQRPGASAACTGARCSARSTRCTARARRRCSGAAAGPASRRPACCGAATRRRTSGRCGRSSRRALSAAASGFSNWSHDVGGYLGARGWSSAARRSCCCAGCSSAASRR